MKLYSLHAAAFFISLSFHTNVLDTVILTETVLRHAVIEIDEEDMSQSAVLQRDGFHIGDLLAIFCCLFDDGKARSVLLLHRRRNEKRGDHRESTDGCRRKEERLLRLLLQLALNDRIMATELKVARAGNVGAAIMTKLLKSASAMRNAAYRAAGKAWSALRHETVRALASDSCEKPKARFKRL